MFTEVQVSGRTLRRDLEGDSATWGKIPRECVANRVDFSKHAK
jgi:hypothetical protein